MAEQTQNDRQAALAITVTDVPPVDPSLAVLGADPWHTTVREFQDINEGLLTQDELDAIESGEAIIIGVGAAPAFKIALVN